jgi:hypothetical protein
VLHVVQRHVLEWPEGIIAIGQGTTVEEGSGHVHITTMEAQQQTGHLLLIGCGVDLVIQSKWEQEGKHAGLLSERTSADSSIETNGPLTKELPDELDQALMQGSLSFTHLFLLSGTHMLLGPV